MSATAPAFDIADPLTAKYRLLSQLHHEASGFLAPSRLGEKSFPCGQDLGDFNTVLCPIGANHSANSQCFNWRAIESLREPLTKENKRHKHYSSNGRIAFGLGKTTPGEAGDDELLAEMLRRTYQTLIRQSVTVCGSVLREGC